MAGGTGWFTFPEHAGQVPDVCEHHPQEQHHTIHYDISKELKKKKQATIAKFLKQTIETHYLKIKNVDLKFDIPRLKKDMESRTSLLMSKTFKK